MYAEITQCSPDNSVNILFTLRSVYACEEHGEVDVSIGELLTNGALDIYEEIANRGFFDINHRRGRLILRATKFVGLIPLSDRVAIHVRPKVPIANLAYMICRAGMAPDALKNVMRTYATADKNVDAPEVLYRDAFLRALGALEKQGLLKQYVREINEETGRVSAGFTVCKSLLRTRDSTKHCFQQTRITADNMPIASSNVTRSLCSIHFNRGQQEKHTINCSRFGMFYRCSQPSMRPNSLCRCTQCPRHNYSRTAFFPRILRNPSLARVSHRRAERHIY